MERERGRERERDGSIGQQVSRARPTSAEGHGSVTVVDQVALMVILNCHMPPIVSRSSIIIHTSCATFAEALVIWCGIALQLEHRSLRLALKYRRPGRNVPSLAPTTALPAHIGLFREGHQASRRLRKVASLPCDAFETRLPQPSDFACSCARRPARITFTSLGSSTASLSLHEHRAPHRIRTVGRELREGRTLRHPFAACASSDLDIHHLPSNPYSR